MTEDFPAAKLLDGVLRSPSATRQSPRAGYFETGFCPLKVPSRRLTALRPYLAVGLPLSCTIVTNYCERALPLFGTSGGQL